MRREESLTFSTLFFSLFIFLIIIRDIQARKLEEVCSSSCGDIRNISFPFRLKGHRAGCGYMELSCQSNKTILELYSGKYYVNRISYNENTIRVVDIDLANGSCALPSNSLPRYDWYNFYSPYRSSAKFLRCSQNINNPAYTRAPCLSGNTSHVYITYHSYRIYEIPVSCSLISVVLSQNVETYPSYEAIRKDLQSGFDLKWSDECANCVAVGGSCRYHRHGSYYCLDSDYSIRYLLSLALKYIYYYLLGPFVYSSSFAEYLKIFVYTANWPYIIPHLLFVAFFICRFIGASIVLLVYIIHKYTETWKKADEVEKFLHNQQSWMPKRYSYPELMAVTNNFQEKLGQGGFGSVYKGQLHSGGLIAVKVLENSKFSGEEFINEVSTIGRIHHINVVQLLGFCSEGTKRALIYEYMPNGSLDKHIFSKVGQAVSFNWKKLHEIALGTARGIEYLHNGCDVCILHFDIKPHNILLDHDFVPKVSDFGLAKFFSKEKNFVSISATRGTIGYIAPELISRNFGSISSKSDIYSFGMLLLEMAGGRRNSDMRAARSSKAYFPSWVYDQIDKGGDLELHNATEFESLLARKLCIIGLWCIQVMATDRPSMTRVIEMLEGSIEGLQMPPKPFFSSSDQDFSMKEIQSDSSTEFLLSESVNECSYSYTDA